MRGNAALRFELGRELDGERGGGLSSFFAGTFMRLLAGDFSEGIEKLLKSW